MRGAASKRYYQQIQKAIVQRRNSNLLLGSPRHTAVKGVLSSLQRDFRAAVGGRAYESYRRQLARGDSGISDRKTLSNASLHREKAGDLVSGVTSTTLAVLGGMAAVGLFAAKAVVKIATGVMSWIPVVGGFVNGVSSYRNYRAAQSAGERADGALTAARAIRTEYLSGRSPRIKSMSHEERLRVLKLIDAVDYSYQKSVTRRDRKLNNARADYASAWLSWVPLAPAAIAAAKFIYNLPSRLHGSHWLGSGTHSAERGSQARALTTLVTEARGRARRGIDLTPADRILGNLMIDMGIAERALEGRGMRTLKKGIRMLAFGAFGLAEMVGQRGYERIAGHSAPETRRYAGDAGNLDRGQAARAIWRDAHLIPQREEALVAQIKKKLRGSTYSPWSTVRPPADFA